MPVQAKEIAELQTKLIEVKQNQKPAIDPDVCEIIDLPCNRHPRVHSS